MEDLSVGRLAPGVIVCMVLVSAAHAFAQSEAGADSLRRLIKLNVSATSSKGEPVTDLRAEELQIREDGKPRPIAFLRFAGSKRAMVPHADGEFANRPAAPPLVILLDRWNGSQGLRNQGLMTTAQARRELGAALQRLKSVDNVYIYFLTNHGELFPVRPLPGTDGDLRVDPAPSPADLLAKLDAAAPEIQGFRDRDPDLRMFTTFLALNQLASQAASIAGRKNLIWVTQGTPLIGPREPGSPNEMLDFTPQQAEVAARAQMAIYIVEQSDKGAGVDLSSMTAQLRTFAGLTGGRLYSSDAADVAIAEAMTDADANYRIAYDSSVRKIDNKEHKIRLTATRKGIRLLTRDGFAGAPEPEPDMVEDAAFRNGRRSPLDATEIGLGVTMSRKAANGTVHFDIRVDPADVLIERRGDRYHGALAVMVALYSEGSLKEALPRSRADFSLTRAQMNQAAKDGIHIPQDVPVGKGSRNVRVMVFDRGLQGLGTVMVPLK